MKKILFCCAFISIIVSSLVTAEIDKFVTNGQEYDIFLDIPEKKNRENKKIPLIIWIDSVADSEYGVSEKKLQQYSSYCKNKEKREETGCWVKEEGLYPHNQHYLTSQNTMTALPRLPETIKENSEEIIINIDKLLKVNKSHDQQVKAIVDVYKHLLDKFSHIIELDNIHIIGHSFGATRAIQAVSLISNDDTVVNPTSLTAINPDLEFSPIGKFDDEIHSHPGQYGYYYEHELEDISPKDLLKNKNFTTQTFIINSDHFFLNNNQACVQEELYDDNKIIAAQVQIAEDINEQNIFFYNIKYEEIPEINKPEVCPEHTSVSPYVQKWLVNSISTRQEGTSFNLSPIKYKEEEKSAQVRTIDINNLINHVNKKQ